MPICYNSIEEQLKRFFHAKQKLSVKLWIDKVIWEKVSRKELVQASNGVEVKAQICRPKNLDQNFAWDNDLLKLTLKKEGKQSEKKETKAIRTTTQAFKTLAMDKTWPEKMKYCV